MHETPEGYLLCLGVSIARTGEMVYGETEIPLEGDDQGQVLIHREEEEVFNPKTIASFEGKPVTITHPKDFVGPDNWQRLAVGIIQNVRRGSGDQKQDLIADLLITDNMAIGAVKNGLREVSCGYDAAFEQTSEGQGIQTKIVGNHLALVEQGRAGSAYAIHDHKGKGEHKMSFQDKFKSIFAKAQDEVEKLAKDEFPDKKDADKKDSESKDAGAYDELCKMIDALSEKMEAMKPKDEEKKEDKPKDEDKKDDEAKDDDVSAGLEDRLKALEAAVSKLMEAQAGDEDMMDEDEEAMDEDMGGKMVGDSATVSRAEILAPGLTATKDIKAAALKAAFLTKEGKAIIEALNGGKAPTYDSKEKVDMLFTAASEVMKAKRSKELSRTKDSVETSTDKGPMTAERQNEINANFWQKRN